MNLLHLCVVNILHRATKYAPYIAISLACVLYFALLREENEAAVTTVDVVIVGAGFSGLSAASQLYEHGIENLRILEAKESVGGRVRDATFAGHTISLGAGWIHYVDQNEGDEDFNPVWPIAQKIELKVYYDDYSDVIYRDGETGAEDSESYLSLWNSLESMHEGVLQGYTKQHGDTSLREGLKAIGWSPNSNLQKAAEFMYYDFENGLAPEQSSATYTPYTGCHQDAVVTDHRGYTAVAKAIANKFLDKILFNRDVVRIQKNYNQRYSITTRTGEVVMAKYVLISVPQAVLLNHRIQIQPPLSDRKLNLLKKSPTGHYCKIFLAFPDQFWDDTNYILLGNPDKGNFIHWQNFNRPSLAPGSNILMATLTGNRCYRSQLLADSVVISEAMKALRNVYGVNIPPPIDILRSNWSFNPHSLGAYSNPGINASPDDDEVLKMPEDGGRLWLTGEYMAGVNLAGLVQGAYLVGAEQGKKLARRILQDRQT